MTLVSYFDRSSRMADDRFILPAGKCPVERAAA
jgi:hypothetical protein